MQALRILVIDDHEDTADVTAQILRRAGYHVATAHTLAGAMALGTSGAAPDMLLCDVSLPDGDGCELLRRLRALYRGLKPHAIAMTGHPEEWSERCRDAGYVRVMTKPVKLDELLAAVAAVTPAAPPPA